MNKILFKHTILLVMLVLNTHLYSQVIQKSVIFKHDPIPDVEHFYWNHQSQILVLDSGLHLPNGSTLNIKRIIVSGTGSSIEGQGDQNGWIKLSDDGTNWLFIDSIGKGSEVEGSKNIFSLTNFKNNLNEIIQFYLYLHAIGGGSSGNVPIFLRYRKSMDGGMTWSGYIQPAILGVPDTSQFRISGPLGKPLTIPNDSLGFPLYYRYLGSAKAYFGFLVCDQYMNQFSLRKVENISLEHPERLIEPFSFWKADTLFTYFRTISGNIAYTYSINNGISWNGIYQLDIRNPSSLSSFFPDSADNFIITNLSTLYRTNLFILSGTHPTYKARFKLDSTDLNIDQVSYPSCFIDNSGMLHISYSKIGYDTITGKRFGDILYTKIELAKLPEEYCPEISPKTTIKEINSLGKNVSFSSDQSNCFILEYRGRIQHIQKDVVYSYTTIPSYDSALVYTSICMLNPDTVLFTNNNGAFLYSIQSKSRVLFPKISAGRILKYQNNILFAYSGRVVQIFKGRTQDTSLVLPIIGKIDFFQNVYSNVKDVSVLNQDSILILNDQGYLFLYANKNLSVFKSNGPFFGDRLFFDETRRNLYLGDIHGSLFILTNLGHNWILVDSARANGTWNDFQSIGNNLFFLGSDKLIIQTQNKKYILSNNPLSEEWSTILTFDPNSRNLDILDGFGKIIRLDLSSMDLGTGIENKVRSKVPYLVYPNPASEKINVVRLLGSQPRDGIEFILLTDQLGREITPFTVEQVSFNELELEISHLNPGLYYLTSNTGYTLKFIKI